MLFGSRLGRASEATMSFVPHGGTTPPEWIERDTLLHTSTVKSCKDREQPVEPRHAIVHSQSVPEKLRLCPPKIYTYLPTYLLGF